MRYFTDYGNQRGQIKGGALADAMNQKSFGTWSHRNLRRHAVDACLPIIRPPNGPRRHPLRPRSSYEIQGIVKKK